MWSMLAVNSVLAVNSEEYNGLLVSQTGSSVAGPITRRGLSSRSCSRWASHSASNRATLEPL